MAVERLGTRKVHQSGSFLIAGGDSTATIGLRDLIFEIRVLLSQDPPTAKYETPDEKNGIFTFVGAIGKAGNTWVYSHIAKFGDDPIGLIIQIQTVSSSVGKDPIFCITYTFADKPTTPLMVSAS